MDVNYTADRPWPRPRYAWYVVFILVLAYTNSFVDRQIIALLVGPIRADLGISDTQISLLMGFSFAVFYCLMGLPIARLADSGNRRNIIAIGMLFWSFMTIACGLARNYWQLFAARVGVGVGEAALSPPAYSMLTDYFPKERLGRAISVYSTGVYIGAGLAYVLGGFVIGLVEAADPVSLPMVGELYPWQLAFLYVGLPGILLVIVMWLTVREPFRQGVGVSQKAVPFRDVGAYLRLHRATLTCHFLGLAIMGMVTIAFVSWIPEYFVRLHGWAAADIGLAFGLALMIFGTAGVYAGGWLADILTRRGHRDSALRAIMVGYAMQIPLGLAVVLAPNGTVAVILLLPFTFFLSFHQGLTFAALQLICPNRLRAQLSALFMFVANLIALGAGPTVAALLTDFVYRDPQALGLSLATMVAVLIPVGLVILRLGLAPFRASVAHVEAAETAGA